MDNKRSWRRLISTLSPHKKREDQSTLVFLLSSLKQCSRANDVAASTKLHQLALQTGLISNIFVATTLVDMYAKLGCMSQARNLFDQMPLRDTVSWNSLIRGYQENGEPELALRTYHDMQTAGRCPPNARTFTAALMACTKLASKEEGKLVDGSLIKHGCVEKGKEIHRDAVKSGCDSHPYLSTTLVDMYATCGSMEEARRVFERMPAHNVVVWTSLILGYAENGEARLALELFSRMCCLGCEPDEKAFVAVLTACANLAERETGTEVGEKTVKLGNLERSMVVHSQVVAASFEGNIFVASTLVDAYSKSGSLFDARRAFDRAPFQDVVTWTAMILGYVENGESELGLELFLHLSRAGRSLGSYRVFTAALVACANLAHVEGGRQVSGRTVKLNSLDKCMLVHSLAVAGGCHRELFVANTLIDAYAKCGSLADARQVFDRMPAQDRVSWTALILGYADNGEGFLSLDLFFCMSSLGCYPDSRAFGAALAASGSVVALEAGKVIQGEIYRLGLENEDSVWGNVMDFHAKCANMSLAERAFESAQNTKDNVLWNALITGHGYQGETDKVFTVFQAMQREGVRPDGVTFLSVLTACSHAGLEDKARTCFSEMRSKHRLSPHLRHYTCMIDLLGRVNHLDESLELLRTMPHEPDLVAWTTVLSACRKWKNVLVGKVAFEALMKLDVKDSAAYVLMGNIYGSLGMWTEQGQVLGKRRAARAWKEAGESWWSDKAGRVHRFMSGTLNEHPQMEEILKRLKVLVVEMKRLGYVPDVGSVVHNFASDVDKEASLCCHSERLAIGCALINSEPGSVIRIGKNLRVCDDCHKATCIISKVEKRTIVCRDANRFHSFVDGKCSCGDFW